MRTTYYILAGAALVLPKSSRSLVDLMSATYAPPPATHVVHPRWVTTHRNTARLLVEYARGLDPGPNGWTLHYEPSPGNVRLERLRNRGREVVRVTIGPNYPCEAPALGGCGLWTDVVVAYRVGTPDYGVVAEGSLWERLPAPTHSPPEPSTGTVIEWRYDMLLSMLADKVREAWHAQPDPE